jgi:glycopeptide antibiotics resistance protein
MYKRFVPAALLAIYAALLVKVMVFKSLPLVRIGKLMLNFGGTDTGHGPNFVPFTTIVPYLLGYKGLIIAGINLVGNIILLVPVGFLVPFIYRDITWKKSIVLAAASGLVIEVAQVLLHVGIFDIDDVILNALGVMLGYGAFVVLARWTRTPKAKGIAIAAAAVVAAACVAVALYLPVRLEPAPGTGASNSLRAREAADPCGGTGGNGQIVSVRGGSFVMRRNNGSNQVVYVTGSASSTDLKTGDRVTLVGGPNQDGSFTADTAVVCAGLIE